MTNTVARPEQMTNNVTAGMLTTTGTRPEQMTNNITAGMLTTTGARPEQMTNNVTAEMLTTTVVRPEQMSNNVTAGILTITGVQTEQMSNNVTAGILTTIAVSSDMNTTSDTDFSTSVVNFTTHNLITTTHVYENITPVTLLFVFGVVGNAIALCVLCVSSKTHKWRPFYRLVCGLAISDGGGILASYPFAEYRYISNFEYTFPKALCDYLGFVFMFTLMSSAMIVCCMSFDRFFAIFFPFLYNTPTKNRRAMIMLGFVWTLSGVISSLHLYGLGASKNYYPGSWCFLDFIDMSSTSKVIYSYIYATSGALVVILTVLINFLVIVFFIKNKFSKSVAKSNRNDLPVVLFLLMIVTVFTSCWAPLMVRICLIKKMLNFCFSIISTKHKTYTKMSNKGKNIIWIC